MANNDPLTGLAEGNQIVQPDSADNLIVNGDFESGSSGFTTHFDCSSGKLLPPDIYDVLANPSSAHPVGVSYGDHTTGSGLMMAINGTNVADTLVWSQTVNVTPNTDYDFSLWASTWSATKPGSLEIKFNGISFLNFTAPSKAGVWEKQGQMWNSGSTSSLKIDILNTSSFFVGNDFALDDISLTTAGNVPSNQGF